LKNLEKAIDLVGEFDLCSGMQSNFSYWIREFPREIRSLVHRIAALALSQVLYRDEYEAISNRMDLEMQKNIDRR
jgi:hypothetical protein